MTMIGRARVPTHAVAAAAAASNLDKYLSRRVDDIMRDYAHTSSL